MKTAHQILMKGVLPFDLRKSMSSLLEGRGTRSSEMRSHTPVWEAYNVA
jgi:hypothetical protein